MRDGGTGMLTNTEIKGAKTTGQAYKMGDQGGLYLHVTESGSKLWRYRYRIDEKQKLLALGQYPDLSLAEAREAHQQARKLVAQQVDPSAQRQAEKQAQKAAVDTSFESMAADWLALHKTKSAPRHYKTTKGRLDNHMLPELRAIDCNKLTRAHVVAFAKQIEQDHGR